MPYRREKFPCSGCNGLGRIRHGVDPDGRELWWECPQCDGTREIETDVWVDEPADVTTAPEHTGYAGYTGYTDTAYDDAQRRYADALDAVVRTSLPEVPPLRPPVTEPQPMMPRDPVPTRTVGIEVERPAIPDRLVPLPDGVEARLSADKERAILEWGFDRAESDTACYDLSYRALAAASPEGARRLLGKRDRIQVATGATEGQLDVVVDQERAREAVRYIERAIDHGRPVILGVNVRGADSGYNEGITDHFLVATGYLKRGGQVVGVTAVDNATGQASRFRFTVDPETGRIFTTGRPNAGSLVADQDYQVTQVRRFSDV